MEKTRQNVYKICPLLSDEYGNNKLEEDIQFLIWDYFLLNDIEPLPSLKEEVWTYKWMFGGLIKNGTIYNQMNIIVELSTRNHNFDWEGIFQSYNQPLPTDEQWERMLHYYGDII